MGSEINRAIGLLILVCCLCVVTDNVSAGTGRHVRVSNGLVSVSSDGASLQPVLDEIADILNAEIYIYDEFDDESETIELRSLAPEDALHRMMRGRNYAVVYNGDEVRAGVKKISVSLKSDSGCETGGRDAASVPENSIDRNAPDYKRMKMSRQIENIENDLASGYADEWYDHWVAIKGERYVTHPQEELNRLKEKMATLEPENM